MEWIVSLVIPAIATITVAIIESRASRERKVATIDRERTERRAADRARESLLSMKMMHATLELSEAEALAISERKLNGEMERAKKAAKEAKDEYDTFVQELASKQVAK